MKRRFSMLLFVTIILIVLTISLAGIGFYNYYSITLDSAYERLNDAFVTTKNTIYNTFLENSKDLNYLANLINDNTSMNEEYIKELLYEHNKIYSPHKAIVITPTNKIITEEKVVQANSKFSFEDAVNNGEYFIEDGKDIYDECKNHAIHFVPITDGINTKGFACLVMNYQNYDVLAGLPDYEKTHYYIVNNTIGNIIASSNENEYPTIYSLGSNIFKKDYANVIDNILNRKSGRTFSKTRSGEKIIMYYGPMDKAESIFEDWSICVSFDYNEVLYNANSFLKASIVLVIVELLICALFYIYIYHKSKEEILKNNLEERVVKAETADKAKSTFLFNMSHDIRTPMNAIVGFIGMGKKYAEDKDKVIDCLNKAEDASKHLLRLINDVLNMARIESGKITIEEERIDLYVFISELEVIVKSEAKKNNIKFDIVYNDIITHDVYLDVLRMDKILINIISNSIKYTKEGGWVKLTITEMPSLIDDYVNYSFIIEDNGIGMSQEFLNHIFDSFVREQSSTSSGIEGTGLGMSIVKKMVDLLGGTIRVDSKLGIGTKVFCELSFKKVNEKDIISVDSLKGYENISIEGMNVLLADDNELNREIVKDNLDTYNVNVTLAIDGADALEKYNHNKVGYFDIILMDVQMPYIDGYQATKDIRNSNKGNYSNIPIIALTANAFDVDRKKALDSGMNEYLSKPIDMKQLILLLKKYYSK